MILLKKITKQKGLSLIELMISLFISALIFAGVINTLLASKSTYLYDDEVAYIQENSRFAINYLSRELRDAGYNGGCNISSAAVGNSLDPTPNQADLLNTTGIEGYEGGVSTFPSSFSANVYGNADAFIVRKADVSNSVTVTGHNPNSANIEVTTNEGIDAGDVMMIVSADCKNIGIFAVTHTPSTDKVQHNSGSGGSSTNCSKNLGGPSQCPTPGTKEEFKPGSSVYKVSAKAFYIGTSSYDPTSRSLFVRNLGGAGAVSASELVSGVEDMQVAYGIDNEATDPDGEANRYYTADAITQAVADGASGWVGWDRVVSARITLVMRSRNPYASVAATKVMPTLGTSYTDRYLYQEISTVVKLRNMALPGNP